MSSEMIADEEHAGPALIRAEEAAPLIGVSTRVLYDWARRRNVIPSGVVITVGRSLYFSRQRLLDWVGTSSNGNGKERTDR
jgi:hypothetical protein